MCIGCTFYNLLYCNCIFCEECIFVLYCRCGICFVTIFKPSEMLFVLFHVSAITTVYHCQKLSSLRYTHVKESNMLCLSHSIKYLYIVEENSFIL